MSQEVTSLVVAWRHGQTGAAQHYRDSKILTIYEGTTAIQANDLVGRKTARDGGQLAKAVAAQIEQTEAELQASGTADAQAVAWQPRARPAVDFMAANTKANPNAALPAACPT